MKSSNKPFFFSFCLEKSIKRNTDTDHFDDSVDEQLGIVQKNHSKEAVTQFVTFAIKMPQLLTKQQIQDWFKFKAFADNKIIVSKN